MLISRVQHYPDFNIFVIIINIFTKFIILQNLKLKLKEYKQRKVEYVKLKLFDSNIVTIRRYNICHNPKFSMGFFIKLHRVKSKSYYFSSHHSKED